MKKQIPFHSFEAHVRVRVILVWLLYLILNARFRGNCLLIRILIYLRQNNNKKKTRNIFRRQIKVLPEMFAFSL
jgi:hypothetical protein